MFFLSPLQTSLGLVITVGLALTYRYLIDINHFEPTTSVSTANSLRVAMKTLSHAKIVPRRSSARGSADHGWLKTFHTFSVASHHDPEFESFGVLRILNEDRVAPGTGFPTHHHRDFEIFSYILSGELTHRDSMVRPGEEGTNKDQFYRMRRGDVQFTTGGKGIAHSEENEHSQDWVHFLQLWVIPWKKGLPPVYHTSTFAEEEKRKKFVSIITPLKAGPNATAEEEKAAVPVKAGTIPIHADVSFSAGIISKGNAFEYRVGGADAVRKTTDRNVYVHLPMTKGGKAKIKLAGREDSVLQEGDGAFVSRVNVGDVFSVESVGDEDAEVVVVDSN